MWSSCRALKPKGAPVRLSPPNRPPHRAASPFGFQLPELMPWAAKLVAQLQQWQTGVTPAKRCEKGVRPVVANLGFAPAQWACWSLGQRVVSTTSTDTAWEGAWLIPAASSSTASHGELGCIIPLSEGTRVIQCNYMRVYIYIYIFVPKSDTRQVCKHRCVLSLPVPKFTNILHDDHHVHSIYLEPRRHTETQIMPLNFAK